MLELSTIYAYMRAHATLLVERILQEYPALHQFPRSPFLASFREPDDSPTISSLLSSDRMLTNSPHLSKTVDLCALPSEAIGRLMRLGFIGTGEITSSIVTGLCSSGVTAHFIRLSPRNSAIANGLATRFHGISVATCNQEFSKIPTQS